MTVPRAELEAAWRDDRRQARARIVDCTREMLEQRPWPQLSLQEIMRAAELSRTAFYRHFEDRQALLLALLGDLADAFTAAGSAWKEGAGDPVEALRAGLEDVTALFVRHGRVLQAIVGAAAESPELRAVYAQMVDGLVAATRARIAAEVAAGRSEVEDPAGVARALLWMNERFLLDAYGRRSDADPATAAAVLAEVWTRTVYGRRRG